MTRLDLPIGRVSTCLQRVGVTLVVAGLASLTLGTRVSRCYRSGMSWLALRIPVRQSQSDFDAAIIGGSPEKVAGISLVVLVFLSLCM